MTNIRKRPMYLICTGIRLLAIVFADAYLSRYSQDVWRLTREIEHPDEYLRWVGIGSLEILLDRREDRKFALFL